jgi:proteic killer suppression protein
MIRSFRDKRSRDFFEGRRVPAFDGIAGQVRRRLQVLDDAERLADLAALRSNRFEHLHGDRKGQCSIRINRQWRICFEWGEEGPFNVEIVDYH